MKLNTTLLAKVFSPAMMFKIIRGFDRATLLIVSLCWAATIVVMMLALFTANRSAQARKDAEAATALEPSLPKIKRAPVGGKDLGIMIDRLQRRYPEVTIVWNNNALGIAGASGAVYHQWLMAIGQVDTLYPQFRWKIQGFCVGKSCGQNLMNVELVGESVAFEMPQAEENKQ